MQKTIQFIAAFCLLFFLCSNVSQPGIYNGGGMAFSMLFPEDSLAYKKVQMQEEQIYIQLYKGYAVVKGRYKMVNTSTDKLSFKMGYPIKGIYYGGAGLANEVELDSIYKFKVKSNGTDLKINQKRYDEEKAAHVMTFSNQNWLTWQMDFLPNATNFIEVYFIVNTNNAKVAKGYNRRATNAFVYLLESGSVWKQPIEKGTFLIELKDNLKLEAITGISGHFNFKQYAQENILLGTKTNFSPTPKDNLIVTYSEVIANFDFQTLLTTDNELYSNIDQLSSKPLSKNLEPFQAKNPYEVKATFTGYLPLILTLLVLYLPYLLVGILVVFVLRFFYKKRKT